jgi:predicted RNA-binding Zn-ribbon protein involved in translation (DUF1610 family)
MSEAVPSTVLQCTQCAGELHPDEAQVFVTCPYCGSTVYLDKSRVVFHWILAPTLNDEKARGALARWMAGNQTVKDLDRKVTDVRSTFSYFPLWLFKHRQDDGQEDMLLEPAAATSVSEIKQIHLPAGDLQRYDQRAMGDQAESPTVPLDTALEWLYERGVPPDEITESTLVHVPLYTFKYDYDGETYTAVVEAATGQVLANIFPAKAETPYRLVSAVTAVVFLCLAAFPLVGVLISGTEGLVIGVLILIGLGIPVGLVLFALASWVASKV